MTTPLVSVVIPTYNQPLLLKEAIDSVLAQTLTDREIIVVNDGSTDDTLEHLSHYGDKIRIVSQENGGIGVARNRGIAEARGKYVALLDHDDYWMPEKLATQVEFLEQHPQCIAATVPYSGSDKPEQPLFDAGGICDSRGIVQNPIRCLSRGNLFLMTTALMFDRKRAAGIQYGIVRGAIEDVQFHLGLCGLGSIGVAGKTVLAVWRRHALSFSRSRQYNYLGIKLLRAMDRDGTLMRVSGRDRRDLSIYLGTMGRNASLHLLQFGERGKGMELYCREFLHQLRLGRFRFLLMYPFLLFLPTAIPRHLFRTS